MRKQEKTLLAIKLGIYPLNQHQTGKWAEGASCQEEHRTRSALQED
jgi:hypothetical protein